MASSVGINRLAGVIDRAPLAENDPRNDLWAGGLLAPGELPPWRAEELGETTFRMVRPCARCAGTVGVVYRGGRTRCHDCKLEEPKRNAVSTNVRRARRRARQADAMVEDLTDEENQRIRAIYEECRRITRETNIPHEVDHIIPISRGGLHHPDNLRIITARANASKCDRMPENAPMLVRPPPRPLLPPDLFSW